MDPINLNLRVGRLPAASAPTGGALSAAEIDANFTNLKAAAEQLDSEKLDVAALSPVGSAVTPTAGDKIVLQRGSAFHEALVDTLLGGGSGTSFPVDVASPVAGQEVFGVVDGVLKRIPIVQLINEAFPAPLGLWDHWTDWRAGSGNANASDVFTGTAISSGTNTTALPTGGMAGYNDHGVFLRSSTTANGGYRYQTTSLVGMFFSGVARKYRCQFLWRTSFTGVTVRTGFHDTSTSADAVDGAYFEISGSTCSAKTASNSVRTTHATTITLSLDVAYTFDIEVNAAASEARFRVWGGNDYDTALMDVTITTNIPSTNARTFGAGIVATESSATASDIGILYSLGVGTPAGFARMYGVYSTPVVRPSAFASGDWTATAVSGGIELNITAMPASGSSAVTAIRYRLDGGAPVTLSGTGTGVRTITGLAAGQAYAVQIQQVTAAGESQWSDTKTRTPTAAATAPAAFTAGQWTATAGASSIVVNITALPSDGGSAITALQYRLNGGAAVAFTGTGTGSRTITGLTPSTAYDVEIRAVNAVGNGAWSDTKSATPTAGSSGPVLRDASRAGPSGYGTSLTVTPPAGMQAGDHLVLVLYGDAAYSSASVGTFTDRTPASWLAAPSPRRLLVSNSFGSVPGSITLTMAGSAVHEGSVFAVSGILTTAALGSNVGTTGSAAGARDHAYTTGTANSLVVGFIDFTGGGVTGATSADGSHTWNLSSGGGYNHGFAAVRATAGSYNASLAPTGASSGSEYGWAEIGAA